MFRQDLFTIINTLCFHYRMVHSLRNIYSFISGEALSFQEDFEYWFAWTVDELELVEDVHYMYREVGDINSVFVSGTVGLNMLLATDNVLGREAQTICSFDRVEMHGIVSPELLEPAPTTLWTCSVC